MADEPNQTPRIIHKGEPISPAVEKPTFTQPQQPQQPREQPGGANQNTGGQNE